ncbi:hypothetical protein ONE63_001734 [Megalurothrips usitatus]|uniref:Uncharacterized protein n=1 Tax=Megalurothrips usitatus TaxID=439358 RepID=A0AAV7XGH2_9NEOP|nr:hypothetical protein ONE63_001734 [Megalurothrips usitatus]
MLDGEADAGERTVSRSMAVMGSGELGGGLTVQDPPAGWPLSELRAMDRQHAEPRPRVSRWSAPMSSSSSWSAVEEPDAAASESRGSIRYYSSTPAPDNGGPVPAGGDQQQMAGQPAAWYADGPHNLGPDVPRQGRVLSAHPSDLNQPSAPPPAGGAAAAAPEHSMTYFTTTQDAEPAAGNDSPMASWQPTNSRYKRKRKGPKQQLQQQQPDQDQVLHQQKQQQDLLQQQQQQQQLLEQQHQQLEQQIQDEQLQHEAPPVEAKKNKKTLKRVNKRRPVTPPQQSQSQPQHQVLAPAPQAGPDPTVSVGYSIGFAAPDAGLEHRQVPVDHHPQQQQQLQQHGEYTPHRGTVQSEVVHGEGAVSYSNTLLPIPQDGGLHQHQQYQEQYLPGTVSSPVINGRPIYVAPIQQAAPAPTPAFHQLALPLPTPQALVGGPGPQITFNSPTSAPVVVSTTPSYVVRTPHTIFTSGSSTQR